MFVKKTLISKGKTYLQGADGLRIFLGNLPKLQATHELETKTLADYTSAGGGNYDTLERIKSVKLSFEMTDFNADNLKIALRGVAKKVSAGTVADEPHVARVGEYVPTDNIYISNVVVEPLSGSTVIENGTDYLVTSNGIFIPKDSKIPAPVGSTDNIKISYDFGAAIRIEAAVNAAKEYKLVFEGINEVDGKPRRIVVHRFKSGMAKDLDFIGDDFGKLAVEGEVLKDPNILAADESPFYYIVDAD